MATQMGEDSVAGRLRQVLAKHNLSQARLARMCGMKSSYVNRVVQGKQSPSDNILRCLLDDLDVSPTWVLFGRGPVYMVWDAAPSVTAASAAASPAVLDALRRLNEAAGLSGSVAEEPASPQHPKLQALIQVIGTGPGGPIRIAQAEGYLSSLAREAKDEAEDLLESADEAADIEVEELRREPVVPTKQTA
jgi:transcriptional regulator with XRE-family HTH domain